jgi:hypothetical protein
MTVVSNITEDGKPVGDHGDGELNWHTDQGFVERPSGYTFCWRAKHRPSGGNTSFANMYNAYERLPDEVKRKIARLKIKHQESHTAQGIPRPGYRDINTSDPRELPVRSIRWSARIRNRSARRSILAAGSAPTFPGCRLRKARRCWISCGRARVGPRTCGRRNGKWAISSSGTIAARCIVAMPSSGLGRRRMHRLTTLGERPQ